MEINTGAAGRMQLGTPGVGMTPFDSMAVRPGLGEAGR
jgi:hypothetical protein